jgi:hypothetical protein
MRNNRRILGIVVIILGILILALVIYLFFFDKPTSPVDRPIEQGQTSTSTLPTTEDTDENIDISTGDKPRNFQEYDISQEDEHEINEQDLVKTAEAIAERFGSFSNYSNYSNFSDLKIFMTTKMKDWAENYVADLKDSASGYDEYYGVTTVAISSRVKNYIPDQRAVITVTTQRIESGSQINEGEAYNQDIEITLENQGGSWLVDSAYWQ